MGRTVRSAGHGSAAALFFLALLLGSLPSAGLAAQTSGECTSTTQLSRDGWTLTYGFTTSDALEVSDVSFDGVTVLESAKVLEWHDDYGGSGFVLSTGCTGAGGGFPIASFGDAQVLDLAGSVDGVAGFEVVGDFRMASWGANCNHRLDVRYRFYETGDFEVVAGAYGRGCGADEIFRPVIRVDVSENGSTGDRAALWNGAAWENVDTEVLRSPYAGPSGPLAYSPQGFALRVLDEVEGTGHLIQPDRGFLGDPDVDDEPFVYVTRYDVTEGATDASPIGGCCLDSEAQGPDGYVDGQAIDGEDIVLWYVPQLEARSEEPYSCWTVAGEPSPETYPCLAGLRFRSTPGIFADGFEDGAANRWGAATALAARFLQCAAREGPRGPSHEPRPSVDASLRSGPPPAPTLLTGGACESPPAPSPSPSGC